MEEGNALVIEIGRRAKAKERAASGAPPEAEEDSESGDVDAIKESSASDVVTALGIDPKDVDIPALATALCDLYEAHMLKGSAAKKAAEY
jgi:hypothetical protein